MHPFPLRRPVDVARRDLGLGDEGDAAVAEIREADGVPGAFGVRRLALGQAMDVVRRGGDHGFDHEPGLGHADRNRRLARGRDRDADSHREDLREGRVALVLVGEDEAARVGQPLDVAHRRHAAEGRQHHGEDLGQLVRPGHRAVLGDLRDMELVGLDPVDAGIGDPLDVPLAQGALQEALGIADPVEAEMADIGLGGDEGHRHLVADLRVAQGLVEDEGEFIGRTEAGGALHRADDHRAGPCHQRVEGGFRRHGVIDLADRGGMRPGPEALDLVEGEFRPGGDHEIVIGERAPVLELDPALRGMEPLRALRMERDAAAFEHRLEIHFHSLALAPADGDPGVRGHEGIAAAPGDHRDLMRLPELLAKLVGHDGAAESGTQDYHLRHAALLALTVSVIRI